MLEIKDKLEANNQELTSGVIDTEEWLTRFDEILVEGHFEALKLGLERAGNSSYDIDDLKDQARGIADTESEFLKGYTDEEGVWHRGFLGDIKSGDDPRYFDPDGNLKDGSLDSRSDLYVGRMRGTANEAFVEGSEDSTWTWVAADGPDECDDCADLGATLINVTEDELFSYPGDGSTACGTNCLCTLERGDGMTGFSHHGESEGSDEDEAAA